LPNSTNCFSGGAELNAPLAVVLTGPTGVGKSDWALQLAQRLPLEIVSVDSAQVFRGLDIGTAKPGAAERKMVPHHLIDIRDPGEYYSAGDFVRDARLAMAEIHARGRVPLLVGGTMLYLRSLLRGMAELPPASAPLRAQLDSRAAIVGWSAMHTELAGVDADAAARIHPNDPQRIQRALEVFHLTGKPISDWQRETRGTAGEFRWLRFALMPPDRAAHRARLAARFRLMLAAGLADEVRALYRRGDLNAALPAVRSVGYRQLWEWCGGGRTLAEATELAIIATCQLSRRQLTWVRSDAGLIQFDTGQPDGVGRIAEIVRNTIDLAVSANGTA
jgi:tRNA dimethylallyltransferase